MCFTRGHIVAVSYLAGQAPNSTTLEADTGVDLCDFQREFRLFFGIVNTLTNTVLRSTNACSEYRNQCTNTPITVNHFA